MSDWQSSGLDRSAYDRFNSREEVKWNLGAYNDGFEARMLEHGQDTCPDGGQWFRDSWLAGWADADQSIRSGDYEDFKQE